MLKKKTAFIVLTVVLLLSLIAAAALASVFATNDSNNGVISADKADTSASAAITAATSFGTLTNGSTYKYTNPGATAADTTITVNTSITQGTAATNPFVISTKEQWLFFVNVITAQTDTKYTGVKYFVLGANIDLGGNSIPAVGRHATGFQGVLYGRGYTISNGTITYDTWISGTTNYAVGLFHKTNGCKIYDLTLASNLKYTMKTDIPNNKIAYIGGLVGLSYGNSMYVNINSYVSMDFRQTLAGYARCAMGGIIGFTSSEAGSAVGLYKSHHKGNLYWKSGTVSASTNGDSRIAGLIADPNSYSMIIDLCSVSGVYSHENGGPAVGGIIGYPAWHANVTNFTITNCVIDVAIKLIGPAAYQADGTTAGKMNLGDSGLISGEDPFQAYGDNGSVWPTFKIQNIYILGQSKVYRGTADTTGIVCLSGTEDNGPTDIINAHASGIYVNVASAATYPSKWRAATTVVKSGSNAAVAAEAAKNTNLLKYVNIPDDGVTGVTSNAQTSYTLSYVLQDGASWGGSGSKVTSYTAKTTAQDITGGLATAPTRTGYTFKGWSLTKGATTGTTGKVSIPANKKGNLTVYAIWALNTSATDNRTAAQKAQTVVYSDTTSVTFTGAVTHGASATSEIKYQWYKTSVSDANKISGATSANYTKSSLVVADTGTYVLRITVTPKDGVTPAASFDFSYTLTVQRKAVGAPTVTNRTYNGSVQTGVSTTSTLYTLSGDTTGTNAKNGYTATGKLKDTANYCWGSTNGGTDVKDKTYTWNIAKAEVAVPSITGTSFTYNGAAQRPTTSTIDTNLVTLTNTAQTDVGSYTTTFTLKSTSNYKWKTAQSGKGESDAYTFAWSITKADITLTAPTYTATLVGGGNDGKTYIGMTVADLVITQSTGTHVRKDSTTSVAGTWSWVPAATTKITKSTTYKALFTPTDTKNYNTAQVDVTITATQLYVNVREINVKFFAGDTEVNLGSLNMSLASDRATARSVTNTQTALNAGTINFPVDYNGSFNLSSLNTTANGSKVNNVTLAWQRPTGYTMAFYEASNATGKISNTTLTGITANRTVYLGYEANTVNYKIITVFQDLKSTPSRSEQTPWVSSLISWLDDSNNANLQTAIDAGLIRVQTLTAPAGSRVSHAAENIEGFKRVNSLTVEGDNDASHQFVTDNTGKLVLGSGHTVLITYYQRNSYTAHWEFRSGEATHSSSANKIVDSWDVTYQYGEPFENLTDPDFTSKGYNFGGWYNEYELSTVATIPATMPARNVNFYARMVAKVYKITYDYNESTLLLQLGYPGLSNVLNPYLATLNPSKANVADNGPATYTIDQVISSGTIRLGTPTMDGFTFVGWAYYEESDANHSKPIIINGISSGEAHDYSLYAMWESTRMPLTVDLNGGNRLSGTNSVRNGTLQVIDERFSDPSSSKYLRPTRSGYEFLYWTRADGTPLEAGMRFDWKTIGSTIRAEWKAVPISIEMTDSAYNSNRWESATFIATGTGADGEEYDFEYSLDEELIFRGNTLVINIVPVDGYEVDRITVGGSTYINGSTMTVGTYVNNKIIVDVRFIARTYTVTYNLSGGQYVGTTTYQRTFTVADVEDETYNPFKLIGGDLIKRTGYIFNGWTTANGTSVGDAEKQISEIDAFHVFNGRNVTLTANWRAAPVTMIYNNNFTSAGSDGLGVEIERETDPTKIYTGATFDLYQPDSQPFVPANRELIGWSTEPNGEIAYAVSYRFVATGEQSKFEPQPVSYTARATEDNTNTLYAIWRVTNVQYVAYEALNNNTTFSTDSDYTGVTLTAYPRYAYQREDGLNLQFKWYKVQPSWEVWTRADVDAIAKEDDRNQAEANIGLHKIPSNATPVKTSPVLTNVTAAEQMDTLNIRNVADAGLYICALTATGSYYSADGGLKKSTVTMYGEFNVVINKQDLRGIKFDSPENPAPYTGEPQQIHITTPEVQGTIWTLDRSTGAYNLPDGSQLKVSYSYSDATVENAEAIPNAVVDVGTYSVEAKFSFLNDNGNYNLPDDLTASFSISPRQIQSVSYVLQTNVNGTWTNVSNFINNVYSRNQFRIVASSADVVASDRTDLEFVIYYDGDQLSDHTNGPTNVGEYSAYAAELQGAAKNNYVLSSNVATQNFSIIRATHNISVSLQNANVKYDGTRKTLPAISITEGGKPVTVTADPDVNNVDYISLSDGSTLVLTYSLTRNDLAALNENLNRQRGAIHAGNYTVTVSFDEQIPADEFNFNPIDDVTATLVIAKVPYSGAPGVTGLTDEELNRYTEDNEPNINGFGDNHSISFNPDATVVYKPVLNLDTSKFRVTYIYEQYDEELRVFRAMEKEDQDKGLSVAGLYRVSATITYIDPQYVNDFEEIGGKVVELRITPGVLDHIEAVYNALNSEHYTYGDGFNFYTYSGGEYRLQIKAYYIGFEKPSILENRSVQFLGEGEDPNNLPAFTVFDRASRTSANAPITDLTTDYTITAVVYGMKATFTVPVQQATLDGTAIGFDDNNVRLRTDRSYEYAVSFDGKGHVPTLAGEKDNYNFKGVIEGDLKSGDIVPVYTYTTGTSGSTATPMPEGGFVNRGTSNLAITFKNNNSNYAAIPATTKLSTSVVIKQRILEADDILWQYSTKSFNDASAADIQTLGANETLPYRGQDGYNVRAVYRNLKQNDITQDDYYITVGQIGAASASVINVNNANNYHVDIKSLLPSGADANTHESRNYVLNDSNMKVDIEVSPKVVELNWVLNDNPADKSLTFNGKNQLAGEDATVKATYNKSADDNSVVSATVSVVAETSANAILKNVGIYTLSANLGDLNYTASNLTLSVAIDKYVVKPDTTQVTWTYGADNTEITQENKSVVYFGAELAAQLSFTDLEGNNVTAAVGQDGEAIRNAGNYVLTAIAEPDNYDLSNLTQSFTITKRPVSVVWTNKDVERVYNGKDYTVTASVTPVGEDEDDVIFDISGNVETNANKSAAAKYTARVTLNSAFAGNYDLLDETNATVQAVTLDWRIEKRTIDLVWNLDNLVYNGGFAINDWSVTPVGSTVIAGDNVMLTTEIYDKDNVNPITGNAFTVAGAYTVRITGLSDDNYTIASADAVKAVEVKKARPVIDTVVYTEYDTNDVTYQNNKGLRDDKLSYNSHGVAGKLTFTGGGANVDLTELNTGRVIPCTFTPDDLANYEIVSYNDLSIQVLEDAIVGIANNKDSLTYSINQSITSMVFTVYFVHASYYVDQDNGQEYGRRDLISMADYAKYGVVFRLNRLIDDAPPVFLTRTQSYTFEMADLNGGSTSTLTVDILTDEYSGSVDIVLVSALPTALRVANEEELQARKYFVGTTFDKNSVQFVADYADSASGSISNELVTCDTIQLLNEGEQSIKFNYIVGDKIVSTTLKINVLAKMTVRPKVETTVFRWMDDNDSAIKLTLLTANDEALPEGINYVVTMADGTPANLVLTPNEELREFKLLIKFTVDEKMYQPIADLNVTVTLTRINADIDNATLKGPWASDAEPLSKAMRVYTGKAIAKADYELRAPTTITDAFGARYEITGITYKITYNTNKPVNDGSIELCNVGTYAIQATFNLRSEDGAIEFAIIRNYSIEITKAANSITDFVIGNWIEGTEAKTPSATAKFGEITYIYASLPTAEDYYRDSKAPTKAGVYRVIASVAGTSNYEGIDDVEIQFTITLAQINAKDIEGKEIASITGSDGKGVNPSYGLKVETIADTSAMGTNLRKQVKMGGYDINIVDAKGEIVENPGEYTVKLLLTEEQLAAKNLKIYTVDKYGTATEITNGKIEGNYMVFTTSNFEGEFLLSARDVAADQQMAWIIGLAVGGVVVVAAVVALVVVIIKKKKEND